MFVRRVEWTVDDLKNKLAKHPKGESIWSPEFAAAGIKGMQLEFLPNGRETTHLEGFCSLFLWCPASTKIRYQLWVGNHLRAPDEDEYDGRMGHGHSNFCNLSAEWEGDCEKVTVGVDILEALSHDENVPKELKLIQTSLSDIVKKEMAVWTNKDMSRAEWRIENISKRMSSCPRGASLYSPLFTIGGVKNVLLEFYPNGSQNTKKDGFCAYYLRGPENTMVTVTLFVGNFKKGPISTTFDGVTGKGLPEFCEVEKEIDAATDSLLVGIELKLNQDKATTMTA